MMGIARTSKPCGKVLIGLVVLMGSVAASGRVIYVDDDGPADFSNIQAAINDANEGDIITVGQGTYAENINFLGKNITLRSTEPSDSRTVRATTINGSIVFRGTEEPDCILTGFNIHGGISGFDWLIGPTNHTRATISYCILDGIVSCGELVFACDGAISNCIFANIYNLICPVEPPVPQIVGCHGLIENCTIWEVHDGIEVWSGGITTLRNCILPDSTWFVVKSGGTLNVSFCNINREAYKIVGGGTINWGPGNIDGDPCFAEIGTWQVGGDYHLKSQAGRYDPNSGSWVIDDVTSGCIDAGDPMTPIGHERFPNGGVVNMGAYGGTAKASKSYFGTAPCETIMAGDINGDCEVNFLDFFMLAMHWCEDNNP